MRLYIIALSVLLLSSCNSPTHVPQAQAATDSEKLVDLLAQTNAKVEQFQFSPDGNQIAYVSAANGSYDVWLMNADGSNARAVTDRHPEAERDPRWSPDGRRIAYISRGEIFLFRADESAPPVNVSYGNGGSNVRWTPDGDHLIFIRNGPNGHDQIATLPAMIPNGPVDLEYLTDYPYSVRELEISPDGRWIAFTQDRSGNNNRKNLDIWLMPVTGGQARLLTPGTEESYESSPKWSPDGSKIAFVSTQSGWRNIGVVDVTTGRSKLITDGSWDDYNPQWSPDGRSIAYVANKQWNFHLMKVSAEGGEPQQLTERDGVSGGFEDLQVRGTFRWAPDGESIAYTYMSPRVTNDIWQIPAAGGNPQQLTNHMPPELDPEQFVEPELISYPSRDGLEIPAFLYRPTEVPADANTKPPLLVYARANTHGLHVNGFYPFIQYFVLRGYVVLAPEVRGSAGNGYEFERMNFGDWGGGDVDDLAAGVEYLAAEGVIDPDRVVMQGGSTGGYFTMQTIVRYPELLQAAVNFYGPTDLVHMYGYYSPAQQPILGDVVGGDHGDPSEAPEHWRERSAIYSIDQIQTPLLILWGDRDYGVRISMGDAYYRRAMEEGKPTEYVLYNNEPHGWYNWRPETLRDALLRVAEHYERYIGGRALAVSGQK